MFERTQIFWFSSKFLRQAVLSGIGFSKRRLKVTISCVYSYIFSGSENFIHIGWAFDLNKFEYCGGDTVTH